jgi:hypothetical protein
MIMVPGTNRIVREKEINLIYLGGYNYEGSI